MVLGGVAVSQKRTGEISTAIRSFKPGQRPIKWTNLRAGKLEAYQKVIDFTVSAIKAGHLHLHTLILDATKFDHQTYNRGDHDLGFNKFLYQLLLHRFSHFPAPMYLDLDQRNTNHSPESLRTYLNNAIWWQKQEGHIFKLAEFREFGATPMMWPVDLIIGAIAFHKNEHFRRPDAARHKLVLANYIARKTAFNHWWRDGFRFDRRFSVWNFQLQPPKRGTSEPR